MSDRAGAKAKKKMWGWIYIRAKSMQAEHKEEESKVKNELRVRCEVACEVRDVWPGRDACEMGITEKRKGEKIRILYSESDEKPSQIKSSRVFKGDRQAYRTPHPPRAREKAILSSRFVEACQERENRLQLLWH